jgi:cysteinyl-tRNA synthetase
VHHTNEIAQTEAVTDKPFSTFWVHNNHLKADGQKMSKSLGNIYTLQDILDKGYDLDAFRVFAFGKHYRTEGNFTWDNLEAAHNRLNHWREAMATRWQNLVLPKADTDINAAEFDSSFLAALSNDLNTSEALRIIDDVADKALAGAVCGACLDNIAELVQDYLGITIAVPDISEDQKQRIADREQARVDKNWAKSDEIRDILAGQEIGLRDTPRGAVWYRL